MGNKIISIGREFGSGGHEIAVRVAEKLGIKVYEKNLVHLACKYGELAIKILEASDEKATNPYLFQTVHEGNYHVARGLPTSEVLFKLQSHEIKRIAKKESCIFVGRCADHVLKDTDTQVLSVFVSFNWAVIVSSYVGILLLGAALIAVGMFISSLTESQLVAAIVTVVVDLGLLLVDSLASVMPNTTLQNAVLSLSMSDRYGNFTMGILDFADTFFFLSVIALFIFLTGRVLEKRRWG